MKRLLLFTATLSALISAPVLSQSVNTGIVDVSLNCLLGSTDSARGLWHDADWTAPRLNVRQTYRFYTLDQEHAPHPSTEIFVADDNGLPEPHQVMFSSMPHTDEGVIALGGQWNAQPRKPRRVSLDNAFVLEDIHRVMTESGISDALPKPLTALEIDLEGDGETEWLVLLTNLKGEAQPDARQGDYSLVLLGRWIDAHPVHFVVASEYFPEAQAWAAPHHFSIRALLDSNGDGTLEIFLHRRNYEGAATSVHRYTDGEVYELLRAGWGS